MYLGKFLEGRAMSRKKDSEKSCRTSPSTIHRCTEPHNWRELSCIVSIISSLLAAGRMKLFSAGCLTIYRWRVLNLRTATVFKHVRHWACPKRSTKKYLSFHAGLKARCSMSTFLFLTGEVADMMTDRL